MRCPLPVDWLDYLDGGASEELGAHLRECVPCQLLVATLRHDLPSRANTSAVDLRHTHSWPHWREDKPHSPTLGDIWWSVQSPTLDVTSLARALLLVISDPWPEGGRSWAHVVPLSTDIETATSLDLLLARVDSDVAVPWRALLRYQTVAERKDLDSRIGTLTPSGRALLDQVLAGRAPVERLGSAIAGPLDSRVALPEAASTALRRLGRGYALLHEEGEAAKPPTRVASFAMRQTRRQSPTPEGLALAAASSAASENVIWSVDIPGRGRLQGRVEYRLSEDQLVFVVEDIEEKERGLHSAARIALSSERLATPTASQPFVPAVGQEILLGRDLGIFPEEINQLELRLSDEA